MLGPRSTANITLNMIRTVNSLAVFGFILPSLWNPKYTKWVRFGFMLMALRQILYVFNFEGANTDDLQDFKD